MSVKDWEQQNVGSIMTHPVAVVFENTDLATVEQTLLEHKIRHLPVVDEEDRIVGVISQRDVYRTVSPTKNKQGPISIKADSLVEDQEYFYDKQRLHDFVLSRVMNSDPEVLFPEDLLGEALRIFVARKIGCIPIVNQRREVVGILTRHDMLKFFDMALNDQSHPDN